MTELRRLEPEDLAAFRTIRLAALADAPDAFGSVHAEEAARADSVFAERLSGAAVFGAWDGIALAGVIGLSGFVGPKERHKGFLWGLYVVPARRGAGLGAALVDAALAHARSRFEQVTLTVVADNPAIGLYRRAGFETYGVEPRALRGPRGYADEVLMVRRL